MPEADLFANARLIGGGALALIGAVMALVAAFGLFRRRAAAVAAHSVAACDVLAWPLVVIGVAIAAWDWAIAGACALALIARWATAPTTLQAILTVEAGDSGASSRHG